MTRKIFFICLMLLLGVQVTALAKDAGLPEEERIKIAVEIKNSSRYKELRPAQSLELFLGDKLAAKNLLNIIDMKVIGEDKPFEDGLIRDEDVTAEQRTPAENIGELLIFDAVEIPRQPALPEDFDANIYRELGAAYVVRCEILGIGATKVEDKTLGLITGFIGSGLAISGSNGNKSRDKVLRQVGSGLGTFRFLQTKRTALNTVVNMQFISVETGEILWQQTFTGQAVKHHHPREGYANAWEQAYIESVEESAKLIAKRVNKYIDKVIIKGKSDKSFMQQGFSIGGLSGIGFF